MTEDKRGPLSLDLHHGRDEDHHDGIAVHLKRLPFTVVWWFALLSHCGCAVFLCATTAIYVFLGGVNMMYYNKLLGSTLRYEMATLGYVFVGIAGLHFLEILRMLWCSIRARKLTFNSIKPARHGVVPTVPVSAGGTPLPPRIKRLQLTTGLVKRLPPRVVAISRRVKRFFMRCKTKLLDRKHGLLGLESPYFNVLFLLRETAEIAAQSYQLYQCSMFISSAWINTLFLAITVLNCWSTPLLQHALARYNALERAVCLTLDGVLDAGTCILIPLVIVFKYVHAFDATRSEFPVENLTDPQWFTALILENRMLFAMNKTDLVTSLMPHYSLFGCMRKAKKLIQRLPQELETEELEVTYVNSMRVLVPKATRVRPEEGGHFSRSHHGLRQPVGEMPGWKRRLLHLFFIGWGTTVLAVHLRARHIATQFSSVTACTQPLRPWFATTFMCASYEFDCVANHNVATVTGDDLTLLDASALSSLVISNCPALAMPNELQRFSGLLKILVYNSTIMAWPASASLNAQSHTSLISIGVVASTLTQGFPDGLRATQPDSLQDIRFAQTNLASLPDDLARSWHVSKISFEYCAFKTFPSVLLSLRVDQLSLAGNRFPLVDESLGDLAMWYNDLVLGDNEFLTALPSTGVPRGTGVLSIENTRIATLPSAITSPSTPTTVSTTSPPSGMPGPPPTPARPLVIYAHNTPLCDQLDSSTVSFPSAVLYCTARDPDGVARFPLTWTIARFRPT
jgi:hypothetical protein